MVATDNWAVLVLCASNVSVPRRAVAWSQLAAVHNPQQWVMFQCPEGLLLGRNRRRLSAIAVRPTGFSAPKGCCLVATQGHHRARVDSRRVSVPRRAVAWSQLNSPDTINIPNLMVSVPRRAVAWSQHPTMLTGVWTSKGFQCPEGLLLGRNKFGGNLPQCSTAFQCPEGLLLGRNAPPAPSAAAVLAGFSAPKGCCLVATGIAYLVSG